jgi:uncharacterized protein (TIGR02231 family)
MHAFVILLALGTPSKVSQVVVYPDRAQVSRTVEVACGAGRTAAVFAAIPPSADPASFRARASTGVVEGLRADTVTRDTAYGPDAKKLDADIRKLSVQVRALRDRVRRADAQRTAAAGYTDVAVALVGREMAEPAPTPKTWEGALDAALKARETATRETVAAYAQIRELSRRLDELERSRARVQAAAARREQVAEALVSCPSGQRARVELTYVVGGARWQPAYEARADEEHGAVELATWATVEQSTGEDWSQANVILSTAVPRSDATPPELAPLRVWAEERAAERKMLVRREEQHEHAEAAIESGAGTTGRLTNDTPNQRVEVRAQGLSVQLAVPEPADVRGDGTPARLLVGRVRMNARFALRAVPKMMPFAFRVADLTNQAPYPLLAGEVDAYRRGGMMARYRIERVAQGATMHLAFGLDESVRVRRVVIDEIERDKGWFGSTRRFKFAYRFEVASYLPRAEELEISDHIPVSELDDVRVTVDGGTTPGYERRDADGILTWKVALKPGERRRVDLAFHVDVPSKYDGL